LHIVSRDNSKPGVQNAGDSYNGAVQDNYRWSQTAVEVDVQVEMCFVPYNYSFTVFVTYYYIYIYGLE
jgi:hypothetical protein